MKKRFHYLHDKLSHIKRLILEYESENTVDTMSIATNVDSGMVSTTTAGTNVNIGDLDNRHYWHKLKRPPLPCLLLSVVGTLLSTLSQNLHFLAKFQGWSFTVRMVPGLYRRKVKWLEVARSHVRYDIYKTSRNIIDIYRTWDTLPADSSSLPYHWELTIVCDDFQPIGFPPL